MPGWRRARPAKALARSTARWATRRWKGWTAARSNSTGPARWSRPATRRARAPRSTAALTLAADDPLAWLLSATLARQAGDLSRAKADIGQALRRAADDAAVQLEAGNIAAASGDELGAKTAWSEVIKLRPDSPQAKAAEAALAQFD